MEVCGTGFGGERERKREIAKNNKMGIQPISKLQILLANRECK
jgi:hypothetical protein